MTRFFARPEDISGGVIRLGAEDAAHIRSLRLRPDELFVVCDGECTDYICSLAGKDGGSTAEIRETRPSRGEPDAACTVYIAYAKGDRLDYAVQKSVELGACGIVLFPSKRCVAIPDNIEKKTARMRAITLETAKQCGRGRVPIIAAADSFEDAVRAAVSAGLALFFYEEERELRLRQALEGRMEQSGTISLMTGPEGGFEPGEAAFAVSRGMVSVSLGPRILRCETAPAAALAAVMYHTGNL